MSLLANLPQHFYLGVGVFALVITLVVLSKRYIETSRTSPAVLQKGASLVKQSANIAYGAQMQQMTNPLLALRNANYAMAYLNVARALVKEGELSEAARVSLDDLHDDIEREEVAAKQRIL